MPPSNLPLQLSSFIGREREIADVKRLLSTSRLVTLTGMGGCGKTRLAIQVAGDLTAAYKDGVWWVALAALADETLVPQAIAQTLGVREVPIQALSETLTNHLRSKELLLVIDNWEHLITACARLAEQLLHACPTLSILAASREPLAIGGETVYPLSTLTLPDPGDASPARLLHSEAVRLFVDRVRAVQPEFALTDQNAPATAQICRRLDGIPLALELAATRVKLLTVQHIAARLDDRFSLLTNGNRTALPRHQTLRATIDWSYDLLPADTRILFRRLAVFSGGFTLNAVEQICSAEPLSLRAVLDLLTRLVDRSLVIVEQRNADERYRMLETIRQYARDKLLESGESGRVQDRHLEFFLKFAEETEPKLDGAEQVALLNRLEDDHDNLRTALGWALDPELAAASAAKPEAGAHLAGTLYWFWFLHSHISEGRSWLRQALARSEDLSPAGLALALYAAGALAIVQGDYAKAKTDLDKSIALYRALGDKQCLARTLLRRGWAAEGEGEGYCAVEMFEESLALQRQLGNKSGIAKAIEMLAQVAYFTQDYDRARALLEEGLALNREMGNQWAIGIDFKYLSHLASSLGDYERATELAAECLAIFRAVADRRQIGLCLFALALATHGKGDHAAARAMLAEALPPIYEAQDRYHMACCLQALGRIACAQDDCKRAARIFGSAQAIRQSLNNPVLFEEAIYERSVAAVRARLDESAFAAAWDAGRALTLEQAIAYSLETPAPRAEAAHLRTARQAAKQEFGGLTEREREVAALVSQGASNREIATELVVGERTVETHVANILNKLGFSTRAQIRKWALEKGLVKRAA